jgi:hypothetical protein
MNTLILKGNWNEIAGSLTQKYANMTNDYALFEDSKERIQLGILQQQLGENNNKLRKQNVKN